MGVVRADKGRLCGFDRHLLTRDGRHIDGRITNVTRLAQHLVMCARWARAARAGMAATLAASRCSQRSPCGRRVRRQGITSSPATIRSRPKSWAVSGSVSSSTCSGWTVVASTVSLPIRPASVRTADRPAAKPLNRPAATGAVPSAREVRWLAHGTPRQINAYQQDPSRLRGEWAAADRRGDGGQHHRRGHARRGPGRPSCGADPAGRRRTRPGKLDADKGYDSASNRAYLRRRGIRPRIARRGIESSQRLGRHRWRVERALSWLSCYRRLQVRWDRGSERFFAFVLLACALVCFKRL